MLSTILLGIPSFWLAHRQSMTQMANLLAVAAVFSYLAYAIRSLISTFYSYIHFEVPIMLCYNSKHKPIMLIVLCPLCTLNL